MLAATRGAAAPGSQPDSRKVLLINDDEDVQASADPKLLAGIDRRVLSGAP